MSQVDTLWREEDYIENFAENHTDLDYSVDFAVNLAGRRYAPALRAGSIGIVHGKDNDGVCFEIVDGKVRGKVGPPGVRGDKRRSGRDTVEIAAQRSTVEASLP